MISVILLAMIAAGEPIVQLLRDPDLDRSIFYKLALRLLLGMAALTIFFLVMDAAGIPINRRSIIGSSLLAAGISLAVRLLVRRQRVRGLGEWRSECLSGWRRGGLHKISWPSLLTSLLLASLVAASFLQMIYLVPMAYDALVGWDLVAKIMSYEGVYRSSVFEKISFNAQATYPPLTACMQGLCYIFTPGTPRIWIPILVLGFMILFGEDVWRRTRSSLLSTFLLLLLFTFPEINFHLTVAQTDMPNMVFVSLAFIWILAYPNDRRSVPLAAVFMFIATLTRSETILIAAAAALWMWIRVRFRSGSPLWIVLPGVALFLFWNLFYVRVLLGYNPADHFRTTLDIDPARAWKVIRYAVVIVTDRETFGELWWLFLGGLGAWLLWIVLGRRMGAGAMAAGDSPAGKTRAASNSSSSGSLQSLNSRLAPGAVLSLFLLTFLAYLPFFYQWDPVLNPLWSMAHTFKRGFFRYVPIMLLFILSVVRLWWVALEIRFFKKA
ncbi:MAG: hypothetical protein KJ970_04510 [Candidatus Eisenbacteria bacterium]|uniref:Uncharacterized protein n=1 Tax=Eiseniibacteriota bacterium TaxID=2212470 RepID=A0A948RSG0_UNCEI|nr:hypothetical protein [Candidatus Eisenbacteria bacterium]MBU1948163.1 hypothetical protein [Candidatus Eisenbacteria bacterium]MBU2690168.1 hypothetical protein [Candidatus Eisenbacteria bacterium]